MRSNLIILILAVIIIPSFADFNRTSGLINIPKANILPHLGFRVGLDGSLAFTPTLSNTDFDNNFHSSLGLWNKVEAYLDIYTINNFTTAIGFCHKFYDAKKIKFAWGIHQLSYALSVSEVGHGDSIGWDDEFYNGGDYKKPFEFCSGFLVSTYIPNKNFDITFSIGRGEYVGYGPRSKWLNSNFYHDQGGDWAVGLFFGFDLKLVKDLSFMLDVDGRNLNLGFSYHRAPIEIGIASTKLEHPIWGENLSSRLYASISYINIIEEVKESKVGAIAGTIFDKKGNSVIAEIGILNMEIPKTMTNPDHGSYNFTNMKPGVYELFSYAHGYKGVKKKVTVVADKTAFCDFTLEKEALKIGDLKGKVIDFKTNEPLVVQLSVMETDRTAQSDTNGNFEFTGLSPNIYDIKAEAVGYETGFYPIVVYEGKETDMLIKMVKRGMVITLKGVKFDLDRATLRPESYPILDDAAAILTNHPEITVEIQGHTCSLGSDAYNLKLSDARANSVRNYLITKHEIEPSRLIAEGYGERQPVADNKTDAGRQENRRVDFVILK